MNNEWIPIKAFLQLVGATKKKMHSRIYKGQWYDGFVIKKDGGFCYTHGNYKHYLHWFENIYRKHTPKSKKMMSEEGKE